MALKLKGSTSGFVAIDAPSVAGNNTLILPENTGSAQQLLGNDITAGVVTFTSVTVNRNGDLTVPGTISIGGTLTYEDVTSVDSVGIVTARSGVRINGGGLTIIGDTTGLKATGISTLVDVSARNITGVAATFSGSVNASSSVYVQGNPAEVRIQHTGNGSYSRLISDSDNALNIYTGGGPSLGVKIDSSGRLLIGTTTEGSAGADEFTINTASGHGGMTIRNDTSSNGNIWFSDGTSGAAEYAGYVQYAHNGDHMVFGTAGAERLRIDSAGKVGINRTATQHPLEVQHSSEPTVSFWRGSTKGAAIQAQSGGTYLYSYEDAPLLFSVNSASGFTERMRITSGGTVQIGGATENSADIDASNTKLTIKQSGGGQEDGIYIERTGERRGFYIYVGGALSQNDALGIVSNQLGGDTAVLSIDRGGDIVVGAGNIKMNTSGKGIDFSATGQASGMSNELLDDYEEGTWTPAYGSSSVTSSTYTNTAGYYTLIGNTVFYTGRIQMSDSTVNGNPITMGGFPFSAASAVGKQGGFDITFIDNWYSGSSGTNSQVTFLNSGGTAYGYFYNGDGDTIAANATYDSARRTLHFKGHYFI